MTPERAIAEPIIDKYKLGMLLFIASEATFFVFLIVAYLYFRGSVNGGDGGPTATTSLDPMKTGLFSVALIGSSVTLWLAGRSLARARHTMVRVWLVLTVVLGGAFLLGQGMEYARLLSHHVTISRNLFGATFFTLTGFHGLHVLLGLVMLSVLLGQAVVGSPTDTRSAAVEAGLTLLALRRRGLARDFLRRIPMDRSLTMRGRNALALVRDGPAPPGHRVGVAGRCVRQCLPAHDAHGSARAARAGRAAAHAARHLRVDRATRAAMGASALERATSWATGHRLERSDGDALYLASSRVV